MGLALGPSRSLRSNTARNNTPSSLSHPAKKKYRYSTIQCFLLSLVLFCMALWLALALGFEGSNATELEEEKSTNDNRQQQLSQQQPQQMNQGTKHQNSTLKATIAYAVSLTSCGNTGHRSDPSFREGAAVLQHSIFLSSYRNPASGSRYDFKLFAFVHPDAKPCSEIFPKLGYEVQIRDTPFNVSDIQGEFLKEHVVKSGCCGEKEYLKLYAYKLLDYPVVVHLDLDSLILKPMDDLFDAMLDSDVAGGENSAPRSRIPVMFNDPLPKKIDAFFTRDYNMVNPGHKHVGVQGGFLVVRPSVEAFEEYVSIVLEGNFKQGNGWGGKGYGGYFGAQQIQGICSYFYDYKHPGTAVELNRCYYNAMADSPRQNKKEDPPSSIGKCRDGKPSCQDCRETPVEEIKSVHFTLCQKPWKCPAWHGLKDTTTALCEKLHQEWFRIRENLEKTRAVEKGIEFKNPGGKYRQDIFHGYCKSGIGGYIPIGGN